MTRNTWHMTRSDEGLTLSRARAPRFDFSVSTELAVQGKPSLGRLAHQIRQDMWRALQNLRGFQPVVELTRAEGAVHIRAGGMMSARYAKAQTCAALQDMLHDPARQRRWVNHASKGASHG